MVKDAFQFYTRNSIWILRHLQWLWMPLPFKYPKSCAKKTLSNPENRLAIDISAHQGSFVNQMDILRRMGQWDRIQIGINVMFYVVNQCYWPYNGLRLTPLLGITWSQFWRFLGQKVQEIFTPKSSWDPLQIRSWTKLALQPKIFFFKIHQSKN